MFRDFDLNEAVAIIAIAAIALGAMVLLGADGKEIGLSLGSALGGYLTKSLIVSRTKPEDPKSQ